MFPAEFLKRIANQNYLDSGALIKALEEPSPVSIRVNPSKLKCKPLKGEPVPWCNDGYYLARRPSYTLDPLFHSGGYYPQEASSMFLEQVISQTSENLENIHVLDLCGAPGGKSIHLSDLIGKGSLLVANETIRTRAAVLAETITKWGRANTVVTGNDPSQFGKLPGFFDIILVDAPCSGEGMFRSKVAVDEWSPDNTVHCAERQKRILMDIWPCLKENGLLIYSTCTFNQGENEENISWLISKQEAECIRLETSAFKGINEIDFGGIWGYGFYPDKIKGEGFFISAIRKTGKQDVARIRIQKKNELRPDKTDIAAAEELTLFSKGRIIRWGDQVLGLPCPIEDYQWLFQNLKIVKAGTILFTRKNSDALPFHELALSQLLVKGAYPEKKVPLSEAIAYLRRDSIGLDGLQSGWNLLTFRGVKLGFVKNIGNRVNNYYPVEWRIRMAIPENTGDNTIDWDIC